MMTQIFIAIALCLAPTFMFSQTTYDCEFQYGDRYNLNSIKIVKFEYKTGETYKIMHVSRGYVYYFKATYINGFLEPSITVYDIDNMSRDNYLYYSSGDFQGKPNYFYLDLITPKIAVDCECERN